MAIKKSTASTRVAPAHQQQQAAARSEPSENTSDRIRAFLASMRLLQGSSVKEEPYDGRAAIERIAVQCQGKGSAPPDVELNAKACADILAFLRSSEPAAHFTRGATGALSRPNWWDDPADAPSHVCGLQEVLYALECHARDEQASEEGAGEGRRPPVAIADRLPQVDAEQEDGALDMDTMDTIERRLHDVKEIIWRVCGVIVCVQAKLGAEGEITDEMNALEVAHEQLKNLADEDIDVLVLAPVSEVQS
jgi:hypothetical protein